MTAFVEQKQRHGGISRGFTASLAFHLCLFAALALLAHKVPELAEAIDQPIAVEIVPQPQPSPRQTAEQPSPHREPSAKAVDARPARETTSLQPKPRAKEKVHPAAPAERDDDAMITARKFYSAGILSDPRSRGAKAALRSLEGSEKMVQTCNLEAMAQIGHWNKTYRPDFVVAYTFDDPKVSGLSLEAIGAAFRSRHHWYRLRYTCRMTARLDAVAGFTFSVGEDIPREQWAQHNLTDDGGEAG